MTGQILLYLVALDRKTTVNVVQSNGLIKLNYLLVCRTGLCKMYIIIMRPSIGGGAH